MKIFVAHVLSAAALLLLVLVSVLLIWTGVQQRVVPESRRHLLRRALRVPGVRDSQQELPQTLPAGLTLLGGSRSHLALGNSSNTWKNEHSSTSAVASSSPYPEQRTNATGAIGPEGNDASEVAVQLAEAVQDGIFWSAALEALSPPGFSDCQVQRWSRAVRGSQVVSLEPGCGRAPNRLARLRDADGGGRILVACVRYGINAEQIVGETLSFYLSRLLGIYNVPPLALVEVGPGRALWRGVAPEQRDAQWADGALVTLTQWVANLSDVVTPGPLRSEGGWRLHPAREEWGNRSRDELLELIQWTDLILFDYLTANFDRLVSNLFSRQWDPRIMERATSNLHRAPGGSLVFIDNEAGLVHGYRVKAMWDKYHEPLLKSVCIFRRRTASKIIELHRLQNAAEQLWKLYRSSEPLSSELGFMSEPHAQELQSRIDLLYKHILHCKSTYGEI